MYKGNKMLVLHILKTDFVIKDFRIIATRKYMNETKEKLIANLIRLIKLRVKP